MPLSVKGYVLEPPRVGSSNSPFTFTPSDLISDQGAFDSHYTVAEDVSRTDYCVIVQVEGLLQDARFGYTKNEGTLQASVRRFDYDAQHGQFKPLPGSTPDAVGTLTSSANTTRLRVVPPVGVLPEAPFRLYVKPTSGPLGFSGVTMLLSLVATEGAFTVPPAGTVQLALSTGALNWAPADLITYANYLVKFQRQSYFAYTESTGRVGALPGPTMLLNPIPGTGQYPLVRLGFDFHLTPIEVPTEGSFAVPAAGTFEWALDTGALNFSPADIIFYGSSPVYYDGTLFSWREPLQSQSAGTVLAPLFVIPVPPVGEDLIWKLDASSYRFPTYRRVTVFDAGVAGEVQLRDDGAVQFSASDQATYGAAAVTLYFGDLPIERGVSMRFFRSTVNLDGSDPFVKDVTAIYSVVGATFASPIQAIPYVIIPNAPLQEVMHTFDVYVTQGTGSFTGLLPDLNTVIPPVGLGYFLDYDTRQLHFAIRKTNQVVTLAQAGSAFQLPDFMIQVNPSLSLELETAPGTGLYTSLVLGVSAELDGNTGLVTLIETFGEPVHTGEATTFIGTTLTDPDGSFTTDDIGRTLLVPAGPAAGVYTILTAASTQLGTDVFAPTSVTDTFYEIHEEAEIVVDRYFQTTTPIDPNTHVERIRPLGVAVNQQVVYTGVVPGQPTATQLIDTTVDFPALGVVAGDTVELLSGPDTGSFRGTSVVEATALTVTRVFNNFSAESYRIVRRLHVPVVSLSYTRIRLAGVFATLVSKTNDGGFTDPSTLPTGKVEISLETGNLNFSAADLGKSVGWGLSLRFPADFRVSKDLGFIELSERLLTGDEMYVTYRPVTSDGVQPSVTEHVGFLIRKELTQPWPRSADTNQVTFNAAGRTVAAVPAPAVFRGGRPQDGTQISIFGNAITFLPDVGFMTDALPSGSDLQPDERVLVDYFVYEAVGGEKSFNVLQPPIFAAQVLIASGSTTLVLNGNQTSLFPPTYLLRIEKQETYQIGTSVYDPSAEQTIITLAFGTQFQGDFTNPQLYVSSGPIRLTSSLGQPSYFAFEMASYQPIARGMNRFVLPGDLQSNYPTGTVVLFSNAAPFNDLYLVSGATFKDGVTTVTLQQNVRRQYLAGTTTLKRSIRPVLEEGVTHAFLAHTPLPNNPSTVYRRVEGQPGVLMVSPTDYTLDASGLLQYKTPLQLLESISVLYSSFKTVLTGTSLRASYTAGIVPSESNGLLGQVLQADYYLVSPDTFYYRVETLTNISGEIQAALQASAQSSSPSAGPITSNASTPTLFQQGRESLFFTELHTANVDYVSRRYLKYFNDAVNRLEDALQGEDGRVVGDINGRFRFDGLIGNVRATYAAVTNEIDDLFKVSDYPIVITSLSPLTFTSVGTYITLYQPSVFSRLYPTSKAHLSAVTTAGVDTGAVTGDRIADFVVKPLASLPATIYRRFPRAQVLIEALLGDTTVQVDHAHGDTRFLGPPFAVGMKVVVKNRDGSDVVSDASPLMVAGLLTAPERLQFAALPVDIPAGATIFLCTTGPSPDMTYARSYRQGFDLAVDLNEGKLAYIQPYPPFDGSVPAVPSELQIQTPNAGEVLEMDGVGILQLGTTPFKFPALYGGVASDCGDQSIPILSPDLEQEIGGLFREMTAVINATNAITPSVSLSGVTVDVTGIVLTYGFPLPAPLPLVDDLVTFTSGPNATAGFRRIVAIGIDTVVVDVGFPSPGTSGTAVITATVPLATSTATFPFADVMLDLFLDPSIQVGHTIIFTSGLNTGVRRQVLGHLSATLLQLDHGVPSLTASTYRVSNHDRTYSNMEPIAEAANSEYRALLTNDHHTTPSVVDSVARAIDRFYDGDLIDGTEGVLTNLLSPASAGGTVAGAVLTGPGQNFVTSGVTGTSLVYIAIGPNAGFYPVLLVSSATQLTVTLPFPSAGAVTFRVVDVFGVGNKALQDLFALRLSALSWAATIPSWVTAITTPADVYVPPGAIDPDIYANRTGYADWMTRLTDLATRLGIVTDGSTGPVAVLEAIVATRDKLYDKRYSWVDARTNMLTGSLFIIQRAIADRLTATTKLYNDLLKLLSVETP